MSTNGQGSAHQVHDVSSMLDAALHYATILRIPVFPCNPDDKRPFTLHGFKDASREEAQIRAWWARFPEAMIGIPTGEISGVWVLDIDVDPTKGINGFPLWSELIARNGEVPATLTSVTPRGGRHLFFLWQPQLTIKSSQGVPSDGIDIRSSGGYVILPPSIRTDGSTYRWDPQAGKEPIPAPAWLIALVSPRKETTGRGKAARKSPKRDLAWAMAALDDECNKIAATPPGQRNAALNLGAYNLYQILYGNPGLLSEEMVRQRLFEAAEKCGLVAEDGADSTWRTIDSAATGAQAQPRVRPLLQAPKLSMVAAAPAAAQAPDPRRVIQMVEGNEHHAIDEAEEALIQAGGFDIYQRSGILVRPVLEHTHAADSRSTITWRLLPVKLPFLLEMLARVAVFTVYDKRSKAWVQKKCPSFVGEMLSAREGVWRLPVVLGIVHTPQFRPDGTLVMTQGYDPGTRLLFKPDGEVFPAVPDNPSRDDALAALKVIEDVIATFPFKTAVDRSVALSLLLTALCRRALDYAPLHGITAPAAGTGKSMLVDLASILISGREAPVMAPGKTEEEAEKRLGAALLAGDTIITFDNCTAALSGTQLYQAMTQRWVNVRILGLSRQIEVSVSALFTATGNNLTVGTELVRRTLLCELDAGVARPELRKFSFNPKTMFQQRRGELVTAGLTVLRAGRVAKPNFISTPLGGFEMWSSWVRDTLRWLDRADPCRSQSQLYETDPLQEEHTAVVIAWRDALGIGSEVTVQQVIERASLIQELRNALLAVAAERGNAEFISPSRLGKWLSRVKNRVSSDGLRITRRMLDGRSIWKLIS
jgi:Bifunctional DNA primase/polymerase, N-terminal